MLDQLRHMIGEYPRVGTPGWEFGVPSLPARSRATTARGGTPANTIGRDLRIVSILGLVLNPELGGARNYHHYDGLR